MSSLSSNDWPALATIQHGKASNSQLKGQHPSSVPIHPFPVNRPPSSVIQIQTNNGISYPTSVIPATTIIGPPPGLAHKIYPQHHTQSHHTFLHNQQHQHQHNQIQYQQNQLLDGYAPTSLVFGKAPSITGPPSRAIPIHSPFGVIPGNVHRSIPSLDRPSPVAPPQPVPHSSFLPRPPPGLLHRRVTSTSRDQMPPVVPLAAPLTASPSHTVSSLLTKDDRDENSTTVSSPPTMSSPHVQQQPAIESMIDGPLDKYATTYVPSWLRDVNQDTQFTLIPLPQEPNYDYDAFVSTFLPRSLVFSDPDDEIVNNGDAIHAIQQENGPKGVIDLVKVDSSWLRGDEDDMLEDLESPLNAEASKDEANDTAHASIGAFSQQHDGNGEILEQRTSSVSTMTQGKSELRPSIPLPPYHPDTYSSRLGQLLQVELTHRRDMLSAQSLYDVQLSVFPESASGSATLSSSWSKDHLYSLRLPGVREDYPNLVTGDLLQLRVLASRSDSWLRIAFEAKVYVVHKVAGNVVIKCDSLASHLKDMFTGVQAARFNIVFISSAFRGSTETIRGVERIGKYLQRPESVTGRVLQRWLFPSLEDKEVVKDASLERKPVKWYDDHLNAEQKGVARAITFASQRRIPFLIHGPPGTGKTMTLVETTLQILRHHTQARILLMAPSVTAADTLALRLAPHLKPHEMTRINDPRRTFEEVPEALLIHCTIEESSTGAARFGLPEWKRLIQTKVVIVATHDIHILHLCKISNLELGRWQGVTISAMYGNSATSIRLHWTHLLVDEAGQSSEAEMANALLLVVPSLYHKEGDTLPVIVLCGDIAQLGPQIDSHYARSHGLDISLLERLSKRKVYHRQLKELRAKARQTLLRGDYGPNKMDENNEMMEMLAENAAHLVRNYRARNASLLHVVSMLFYDDCLLPCAPASTLDLTRWTLPNNQLPILFEHIDSKDEWVDEGASFYNTEEIEKVIELCKSLTSKQSGLVKAKDIAVITPYREQVWRIRLKLRKLGLGSISVGNVEVYQGAEHKISIISTVRSSSRFLETDAKRNLGLVYERKRLCVALSRAQEVLIIVGNAKLLRLDSYWKSFISYAKRNKALLGHNNEAQDEEEEEEDEDNQVGALEYAARMSGGGNPSEKDTAYLAGRMAASALYEDDEEEDDAVRAL